MANDHGDAAAPRPRRRRTDIDPKAPTPKVANERRRAKRPATPRTGPAAAPAGDPLSQVEATPTAVPPSVSETPPDRAATPEGSAPLDANGAPPASPTTVFHLPGGVASAGSNRSPASAAATGTSGVESSPRTGWSRRDPATDRPSDDADAPGSWLPSPDDRSLDPAVCPFLRAAVDGQLTAPIETPDPANRCAALRDVVPQSRRQQELVCLTTGHVDCPRYLRGSAVAPEVARPTVGAGMSLSPAVIASLLVVVLAFSASVAFVVGRGGIALQAAAPSASASPSTAAEGSPSAVATADPSVAPVVSPSPSPSPTASPTPEPTAASPTPAPTATPRPTSNRYELLTACPNTPRCWIYRVRSGDNLFSIANYFGVSLDSIYDRNPWLRDSGLRQGQELRLPPPTR